MGHNYFQLLCLYYVYSCGLWSRDHTLISCYLSQMFYPIIIKNLLPLWFYPILIKNLPPVLWRQISICHRGGGGALGWIAAVNGVIEQVLCRAVPFCRPLTMGGIRRVSVTGVCHNSVVRRPPPGDILFTGRPLSYRAWRTPRSIVCICMAVPSRQTSVHTDGRPIGAACGSSQYHRTHKRPRLV